MPTMTKAGYTPAPQSPKKPGKKRRKKKKGLSAAAIVSLVIFLLACVIGAATLFVYAQTAPYQHTFLPGTMLLGYPLGGATMEQAKALLHQITESDVSGWTAEIRWERQSYILTAQDLSVAIDEEATLDPLWQVGRTGGMPGMFVEMLRLREETLSTRPVLTYDLNGAEELFTLIRQDIACEPVDATVSYTPGKAEPFSFTTESIGYEIDLSDARAQIEIALATLNPVVVELEPKKTMPRYTREDLESALVLRARVVTALGEDEATLANATLAAKALSGVRIDAGESLSFNETVGARSAARGYLDAEEPAYGDGVIGPGGGVCRVSTALYQAALLGGLGVSQRHAAVRPVNYCAMGQEAAVSDQGIDLTIDNTTEYPLFVLARTYEHDDAHYLDVQLVGEASPARIWLESEIVETTLIEEPVYVRDHAGKYATYDDERVPAGEAVPGYTVRVTRVTHDASGAEISAEVIGEDVYEPIPPAIYVGVQKR